MSYLKTSLKASFLRRSRFELEHAFSVFSKGGLFLVEKRGLRGRRTTRVIKSAKGNGYMKIVIVSGKMSTFLTESWAHLTVNTQQLKHTYI
jgi:hypothetical protein